VRGCGTDLGSNALRIVLAHLPDLQEALNPCAREVIELALEGVDVASIPSRSSLGPLIQALPPGSLVWREVGDRRLAACSSRREPRRRKLAAEPIL
jgi:hypothetical protein